jgi:hypothetical protein
MEDLGRSGVESSTCTVLCSFTVNEQHFIILFIGG